MLLINKVGWTWVAMTLLLLPTLSDTRLNGPNSIRFAV